jgi:DNA-binding transcriptional regulator GbsR (MarR family)
MQQDAPPRRDEAEIGRAVERLAARLVESGLARMPARVFAAIFTSPEGALTAAEIAERLSVSPAAVSKAVQTLTQVRLLHREYVPGSRRDRYRVGEDVWAEVWGFRVQWLRSMAATAQDSIDAVGGQDSDAGARMAELRDLCVFLTDELVAILDHWREHRTGGARPAAPTPVRPVPPRPIGRGARRA